MAELRRDAGVFDTAVDDAYGALVPSGLDGRGDRELPELDRRAAAVGLERALERAEVGPARPVASRERRAGQSVTSSSSWSLSGGSSGTPSCSTHAWAARRSPGRTAITSCV